MSNFKYNQSQGKDTFRTVNEKGDTQHKGSAKYDSNGSMVRLDIVSPSSSDPKSHHHEWINKNPDGSYEYGHGEHLNHPN